MTRFALEPRQFAVEATAWETELADVLEETFARGTHDLAGIVEALNRTRVRAPEGGAWTEASLRITLARLGA